MGFFNDLKEDLVQAVNELTDENAKKEIRKEEEILKSDVLDIISEIESNEAAQSEVTGESSENDRILDSVEYINKNRIENEFLEDEIMELLKEDGVEIGESQILSEEETMIQESNLLKEDGVEIGENKILSEEETPIQESDLLKEDGIEIEESILISEESNATNTEGESELKENEEVDENDISRSAPSQGASSNETAVITSGMKIKGDLTSVGNLEVNGTIEGNISILGKLEISGNIIGNSKATEIFVDHAKIKGELRADSSIKIGKGSVVIGNIYSNSAVIAGAVKGIVDVPGPVVLDASAVVKGEIRAKSVQVNNGALVEGNWSICYSDMNADAFFENEEL